MLYAAPRVAAAVALERLSPPRGLLRRRRPGVLADKRLPHLELVWLPFLRVSRSDGRSCVVCATTGLTARLGAVEPALEESAPVAAPAIARERLLEIASGHLSRIARMTGNPASRDETVDAEELALPFWVLHYERRRGRLDFLALDATSGAKVGGAVRQALVRALLAGALPASPSTTARSETTRNAAS